MTAVSARASVIGLFFLIILSFLDCILNSEMFRERRSLFLRLFISALQAILYLPHACVGAATGIQMCVTRLKSLPGGESAWKQHWHRVLPFLSMSAEGEHVVVVVFKCPDARQRPMPIRVRAEATAVALPIGLVAGGD